MPHYRYTKRKVLTDVAVLLHDLQELDDDLGAWADQDLTLSSLLGLKKC
jgi:hypothetical protein